MGVAVTDGCTTALVRCGKRTAELEHATKLGKRMLHEARTLISLANF